VDSRARRHPGEHGPGPQSVDLRATSGRFARTWLRSLGFLAVGVDFLQNFDYSRSARDRLIEMKMQMGREFHGHPSRELRLKGRAMLSESRHYAFSLFRSEDADKNMRALQIRVDLNVIDGDKRAFETNFSRNDSTQFPFYDFVDPQHAMFHVTLSFPSKFLGHSLELIAFDDIAHL